MPHLHFIIYCSLPLYYLIWPLSHDLQLILGGQKQQNLLPRLERQGLHFGIILMFLPPPHSGLEVKLLWQAQLPPPASSSGQWHMLKRIWALPASPPKMHWVCHPKNNSNGKKNIDAWGTSHTANNRKCNHTGQIIPLSATYFCSIFFRVPLNLSMSPLVSGWYTDVHNGCTHTHTHNHHIAFKVSLIKLVPWSVTTYLGPHQLEKESQFLGHRIRSGFMEWHGLWIVGWIVYHDQDERGRKLRVLVSPLCHCRFAQMGQPPPASNTTTCPPSPLDLYGCSNWHSGHDAQ